MYLENDGGFLISWIIDLLEHYPKNTKLPYGLKLSGPWRGYYDILAFNPVYKESTTTEWIKVIKESIKKPLEAYKGNIMNYTLNSYMKIGDMAEESKYMGWFFLHWLELVVKNE